jgi:hypothetical protein
MLWSGLISTAGGDAGTEDGGEKTEEGLFFLLFLLSHCFTPGRVIGSFRFRVPPF